MMLMLGLVEVYVYFIWLFLVEWVVNVMKFLLEEYILVVV